MRPRHALLVSGLAFVVLGMPAAGAQDGTDPTGSADPVPATCDGAGHGAGWQDRRSSAPWVDPATLPETIPLPNGFQPEGIVFGYGPVLYAGSLADGAIYAANVLTGEGNLLVEGQAGRVSVGLDFDHRTGRLYVSGGATGAARIYDAATGTELAELQFASEPTFVNDVTVGEDAAWFTDSARPVLYRVPLDDPDAWSEVPLGGEFTFDEEAFNANGIVAADSDALLVVHSGRGELYRVDPATGDATLVDLGGVELTNGDGLVLGKRSLYVIQNRINQVSVVDLADDLSSGEVTNVITSELFRVPTTGDLLGRSLYVVNARFGTEPGPDVDYDVVRVDA